MSSIFWTSDPEIKKINPNFKRNAHIIILFHGKVYPTHNPLFQTSSQMGELRVDRGVRTLPCLPQTGTVTTNNTLAVREGRNSISLFGRSIWGCKCYPHPRNPRGAEAHLLHEQSLTSSQSEIPTNQESSLSTYQGSEVAETLFLGPYNCCSDRATNKVVARMTQ